MPTDYESLSKEELIGLLKRRDSRMTYGLSWEQKNLAQDTALNRDFVGLELDAELSGGQGPWNNLVIEGDNYDALRNLVSAYAGMRRDEIRHGSDSSLTVLRSAGSKAAAGNQGSTGSYVTSNSLMWTTAIG